MPHELQDEDIVHIIPVCPTGASSQVEAPVTLAMLAAFVLAKLQPEKEGAE